MEAFQCSCQALMRHCAFWLEVESRMHERGVDDFNLANFKLNFVLDGPRIGKRRFGARQNGFIDDAWEAVLGHWPGYTEDLRKIGDRTKAFALSVLETSGKHVFVDATKQITRARHLINYLDFDIRIVYLVRSAKANVYSTLKRKQKAQGLAASDAAKMWLRDNHAILRGLAKLPPEKTLVVRYEELCSDPQDTMSRVFDFCGVEADVKISDFREKTQHQHILGNSMRLSTSSEIALDEQWRHALSELEIAQIDDLTNVLMTRLYWDA